MSQRRDTRAASPRASKRSFIGLMILILLSGASALAGTIDEYGASISHTDGFYAGPAHWEENVLVLPLWEFGLWGWQGSIPSNSSALSLGTVRDFGLTADNIESASLSIGWACVLNTNYFLGAQLVHSLKVSAGSAADTVVAEEWGLPETVVKYMRYQYQSQLDGAELNSRLQAVVQNGELAGTPHTMEIIRAIEPDPGFRVCLLSENAGAPGCLVPDYFGGVGLGAFEVAAGVNTALEVHTLCSMEDAVFQGRDLRLIWETFDFGSAGLLDEFREYAGNRQIWIGLDADSPMQWGSVVLRVTVSSPASDPSLDPGPVGAAVPLPTSGVLLGLGLALVFAMRRGRSPSA